MTDNFIIKEWHEKGDFIHSEFVEKDEIEASQISLDELENKFRLFRLKKLINLSKMTKDRFIELCS